MVELATRLNPELTFKAGSAEDLPFADGTFDPVGCNFGMHHFPHPEKALAEVSASRILRPGGRIAFTVWASRDKAIALGMVLKAIEACGETDFGLRDRRSFGSVTVANARVLLEADIARSPLALSKGAGYAYS
jgi:SAM-dependent methyltransferase